MLTWNERTDGWYANGFRIELAAPFRWLLLDAERETASVSVGETPLAVARTLTEAKREAELVLAARRRAELRRKHLGIIGLIIAVGILLVGDPAASNPGWVVALSLAAARSIGVVVGTIFWRVAGPQHDVFYQ